MDRRGQPDSSSCVRIARAAGGDSAALSELVRRLSPLLLGQARARMSAALSEVLDEQDLVQDVWAIALPRLSTLRERGISGEAHLLAFLGRVLLNRLNNVMRKVARRGRLDDEVRSTMAALDAETSGIVTSLARRERAGAVMEALDSLDDADRMIVVMRACEGASIREISDVLRLRENTVSVRYRRALGRLAVVLPSALHDELSGR